VKLLIVRHGAAGDRESWQSEGRDDRLRPLTSEGKKEVRRAAAGLVNLLPDLPLLATSALVRATQTADILAKAYGCDIVSLDALEPDEDPSNIVEWLQTQQPDSTIGLVGHEPHLSTLVGYLLTGDRDSFIDLKKGGACLLKIDAPIRAGGAELKWLLAPRELAGLGA
jgi:phosphohistidine phosphatase